MSDKTLHTIELEDSFTNSLDDIISVIKSFDELIPDVLKDVNKLNNSFGNSKTPINELTEGTKKATSALSDVSKISKDAFNANSVDELTSDIDKATAEIDKITNALKVAEKATDKAFDDNPLEKYNADVVIIVNNINGVEKSLKETKKASDGLESKLKDVAKLSFGAFVADGIYQTLINVENLEKSIRKMKLASADAAPELVKNISQIAGAYSQESSEILRATNAVTKQMGGSANANLQTIELAMDLSIDKQAQDDFLSEIQEYAPQLKEIGLDFKQSTAFMLQAQREGVFSDKAVDTLKEAKLSLLEMTDAQVDALSNLSKISKGFDVSGQTLSFKQLKNGINSGSIDIVTAVKSISAAMQENTTNAKVNQTVIADIFKGAGEDAGAKFINSLANVDLSLSNVSGRSQGFSAQIKQINSYFTGLKITISQQVIPVISSFIGFLDENEESIKVIGAALLGGAAAYGIYTAATKAHAIATKGVTAAQWLLNVAMNANPVMLLATGIGVAVGLIIYYWDEIKAVFSEGIDYITSFIERPIDKFKEFGTVGKIISFPFIVLIKIGKLLFKVWSLGVDKIKIGFEKIGKFVSWLGGYFSQFIDWMKTLGTAVLDVFTPAFDAIKGFFTEIWDWIYNNIIKPLEDSIGKIINWFLDDDKPKEIKVIAEKKTTGEVIITPATKKTKNEKEKKKASVFGTQTNNKKGKEIATQTTQPQFNASSNNTDEGSGNKHIEVKINLTFNIENVKNPKQLAEQTAEELFSQLNDVANLVF